MALALWLVLMIAPAGAQLPQTDIYWVQFVTVGYDGARIDTVINLTHRSGYDNQPIMSYDGVYFSSNRDGVQNDIYKISMESDSTWMMESRVTETPESEYSPTFRKYYQSMTVVRVEADSSQQIQELSLLGHSPVWPLRGIEGTNRIGYHTWLDSLRLIIFALGETNDLSLVDLKSRSRTLVARNVGRCFGRRSVSDSSLSFVQLDGDSAWLSRLDLETGAARPIALMPEGVQDFVHMAYGRGDAFHDLCAKGSVIYRLLEHNSPAGATWVPWLDLDKYGIREITRISDLCGPWHSGGGMLVVAADQKSDK